MQQKWANETASFSTEPPGKNVSELCGDHCTGMCTYVFVGVHVTVRVHYGDEVPVKRVHQMAYRVLSLVVGQQLRTGSTNRKFKTFECKGCCWKFYDSLWHLPLSSFPLCLDPTHFITLTFVMTLLTCFGDVTDHEKLCVWPHNPLWKPAWPFDLSDLFPDLTDLVNEAEHGGGAEPFPRMRGGVDHNGLSAARQVWVSYLEEQQKRTNSPMAGEQGVHVVQQQGTWEVTLPNQVACQSVFSFQKKTGLESFTIQSVPSLPTFLLTLIYLCLPVGCLSVHQVAF